MFAFTGPRTRSLRVQPSAEQAPPHTASTAIPRVVLRLRQRILMRHANWPREGAHRFAASAVAPMAIREGHPFCAGARRACASAPCRCGTAWRSVVAVTYMGAGLPSDDIYPPVVLLQALTLHCRVCLRRTASCFVQCNRWCMLCGGGACCAWWCMLCGRTVMVSAKHLHIFQRGQSYDNRVMSPMSLRRLRTLKYTLTVQASFHTVCLHTNEEVRIPTAQTFCTNNRLPNSLFVHNHNWNHQKTGNLLNTQMLHLLAHCDWAKNQLSSRV
jgi:hypothetical protein